MSIAVERMGQGPELVLLHGWGMNGAVWHGVAPELARHYHLHILDLPGFGASSVPDTCDYTLPWLADAVSQVIPERATLLGWSLGGLVASQLALTRPERVERLITVASSPCFMSKEEWPGIAPKVLHGFQHMLQGDFMQTIERFLAIQAMGSEHARNDIRQLRHWLAQRPQPSPLALAAGLKLLETVDLREAMHNWQGEWLRIYGRLDSLVPKSVIPLLDERYPASHSRVFDKASHAPFISHPHDFVELLAGLKG